MAIYTTIEQTEIPKIENLTQVKVKDMGNIVETMYMSKVNHKCGIKKLNKNEYLVISTGEIKQFKHIVNRQNDINSVRSSLRRLRDYINNNVRNSAYCKWITLTYAENMTDTKRLYKDFDKFMKRLKYNILVDFEYIVAMEPQGRGAWHAHLILIFDRVAPYIANNRMAELWGQGFTKTKKLDNVDNIGAYLTAYLGDIELNQENLQLGNNANNEIKTVQINGKSKRYIKGGRLCLYPPKFNLYRCSKGIEKPKVEEKTEEELQEQVKCCEKTFEKALKITFYNDKLKENGALSSVIIYYRHYNKKRKIEPRQRDKLLYDKSIINIEDYKHTNKNYFSLYKNNIKRYKKRKMKQLQFDFMEN